MIRKNHNSAGDMCDRHRPCHGRLWSEAHPKGLNGFLSLPNNSNHPTPFSTDRHSLGASMDFLKIGPPRRFGLTNHTHLSQPHHGRRFCAGSRIPLPSLIGVSRPEALKMSLHVTSGVPVRGLGGFMGDAPSRIHPMMTP